MAITLKKEAYSFFLNGGLNGFPYVAYIMAQFFIKKSFSDNDRVSQIFDDNDFTKPNLPTIKEGDQFENTVTDDNIFDNVERSLLRKTIDLQPQVSLFANTDTNIAGIANVKDVVNIGNKYYAFSTSGGIYESDDNGDTWENSHTASITASLVGLITTTNIQNFLYMDITSPIIRLVFSDGIFIYNDNNNDDVYVWTYHPIAPGTFNNVTEISNIVHFRNNVVAVGTNNGIFLTLDIRASSISWIHIAYQNVDDYKKTIIIPNDETDGDSPLCPNQISSS